MKGTPTKRVYFKDEGGDYTAELSDEFRKFAREVEVGDYVAVVYETPSNAGSLHRAMGHVRRVGRVMGSVDLQFRIEDGDSDTAGEKGHLSLDTDEGGYQFNDEDEDAPPEGWRVERLHHTREEDL